MNSRALVRLFLPLLVFIASDYLFGPLYALLIAAGMRVIEFLLYWHKRRQRPPIPWFDILLLAVFFALTVPGEDFLPAGVDVLLFETLFLLVLAASLWGPWPFLQREIERLVKQMLASAELQREQTDRVMRQLLIAIATHAFFLAVAIGLDIKYARDFLLHPLTVTAILLLIAAIRQPFLWRRIYWSARYAGEEWLPVIDPKSGKVRFAAPRTVVHRHDNWLHPVVHINLLRHDGSWYIQLRGAGQKAYPGCWDVSIAGHIALGESIADAGEREAREEMNIALELPSKPHYIYQQKGENDMELVHAYVVFAEHLQPRPNANEADDGRWLPLREVDSWQRKMATTPAFRHESKWLTDYLMKRARGLN
jgi:isopentenyldiphosphate isomerase/intracellular septation protein A